MANIFLIAKGLSIGQGSLDYIMKSNYGEFIDKAKDLLAQHAGKITLPTDLAWVTDDQRHEAPIDSIHNKRSSSTWAPMRWTARMMMATTTI